MCYFLLIFSKDIMVNLYQLYFSSSHFLSQPNKKVFYPSTFPPFQLNTNEGKLNLFYPPTFPSSHNFPFSHFSTPPSKQSLTLFSSLSSSMFLFFYLFVVVQLSLKHTHRENKGH